MHRTWSAAAHPQWLVFEVEGQLQIRPAQYHVAQHLMADPGAIAQLNMGEGKTRVILPMLALHWGDGSNLVRGQGDTQGYFSLLKSSCHQNPCLLYNSTCCCT